MSDHIKFRTKDKKTGGHNEHFRLSFCLLVSLSIRVLGGVDT